MAIFITGGAGYIGSHLVRALVAVGEKPVVIDDYSGENTFPKCAEATYLVLSIYSKESKTILKEKFSKEKKNVLIHLAGLKSVEKSLLAPQTYLQMNLGSTRNLLEVMELVDFKCVIFASSAAVYGPQNAIVSEESSTSPISNYGQIKLREESLIQAFCKKKLVNFALLRFFNVIGASSQDLCERKGGNIFPMLQHSLKNNTTFKIFGNRYPTIDGTCVRDYIDVRDLVDTLMLSLRYLESKSIGVMNIASGHGASVLEIVKLVSAENSLEFEFAPERSGDIPELVADVQKLKKMFQWAPKYSVSDSVNSSFSF